MRSCGSSGFAKAGRKMSEEDAPERIAITWSSAARADVRAIERNAAIQILSCIDDYITKPPAA